MTTLWHLPEDHLGKNPYGQLLMRSLEARGLRVVPIPTEPLFALRARKGRPDIVHFQFVQPYILPALAPDSRWQAVVKGVLFLLQVAALRVAGARIVWTVHNLVNHERRLASCEQWFTRLFTRLAHVVVAQCEAAREAVVATYGMEARRDRVAVIPHPNYLGAYPDEIDRTVARRRLGISDDRIMILSLGQIRGYKGLLELVAAFQALGAADCELWIAGEPVDQALAGELQRVARESAAIHVRADFLSPGDVEVMMKACDVVALPYCAILTSGAAVLAMTFSRPCVAPRLGCLPEVLDDDGAFLYDPRDPDGLRHALGRAVAAGPSLQAMGRHNRARVEAWSWPATAEALENIYRARSP